MATDQLPQSSLKTSVALRTGGNGVGPARRREPCLDLGLIGCGHLGRRHADLIHETGLGRFVAFADVRAAAADRLASSWPNSYSTHQAERVLEDPNVHAIYICTHHDSHPSLAIAAMEAGKDVFLEKPLALSLDEAEAVAVAVRRTGRIFMPGFVMRFHALVGAARAFLPRPDVLVGQMMCSRWPDDKWAQHPQAGGGNILSQGCHTADLLIHLAGSRPMEVWAAGGAITHPGHPCIDQCVATIRFESGQVASWIQGDAGHGSFTSKIFIELFGGDRSVQLHNRLAHGHFTTGSDSNHQVEERRADPDSAWGAQTMAFLEAVLNRTRPPVSIDDALLATELVMLADRSVRTGAKQRFSSTAHVAQHYRERAQSCGFG